MNEHKTNCSIHYKCNHCKFYSQDLEILRNHMNKCQKTTRHLNNRIDDDLRQSTICKFWRRGDCRKGDQCNYAHPRESISYNTQEGWTQENRQRRKDWVPPCRNGPQCHFLNIGRCKYYHKNSDTLYQQNRNQNRLQYQQNMPQYQHNRNEYQQNRNQYYQNRNQYQQNRNQNHQNRNQYQQNTNQNQHNMNQYQQRRWCNWNEDCNRVPNCPNMHSMEDFPSLQMPNQPTFREKQRNQIT